MIVFVFRITTQIVTYNHLYIFNLNNKKILNKYTIYIINGYYCLFDDIKKINLYMKYIKRIQKKH